MGRVCLILASRRGVKWCHCCCLFRHYFTLLSTLPNTKGRNPPAKNNTVPPRLSIVEILENEELLYPKKVAKYLDRHVYFQWLRESPNSVAALFCDCEHPNSNEEDSEI